ncbi:hypothetical protein [Peribacillus saganii]|uniref:hypothetical protein n=1 Tax=Peribacillus saganii TaxID=2303992 RepID=UPI00115EDA0B|nr:hypothetical protein [Peribacillus saganii]
MTKCCYNPGHKPIASEGKNRLSVSAWLMLAGLAQGKERFVIDTSHETKRQLCDDVLASTFL